MRQRVNDARELAWRVSCVGCAAFAFVVGVRAAHRTPTDAVIPVRTIDVNTAPASRLRLLEGVGPTLAARIVADREANGAFASLEDLDRVPRVGSRTLIGIAPDVSFGLGSP